MLNESPDRKGGFTKKESVAYHEAGHAVVNVLFDRQYKQVVIDLSETAERRGHVDIELPEHFQPVWNKKGGLEIDWEIREEVEIEMISRVAGMAAEYILTKQDETGGHNDKINAKCLARYNYPNDPEAAHWYFGWACTHTQHMLRQNTIWRQVEAVARALLDNRILSRDEVARIMKEVQSSETK